jgi:putative phage-type endonuclease
MPELIDVVPGSPEWLAARRAGITATDLPAILGISPYDSPYSLYYRKLGVIPDVPDCPRFALGRYLEPYIAQLWLEGFPGWTVMDAGLWRSTERPWQLATLDGLVYRLAHHDGKVNGIYVDPSAVLELKSWADMDRDRWDNGPPAAVRAQVLWQMDVMGVARGHVAVLFLPSGDLRSYVIEHDAYQWPHAELGPDGATGDCRACADIELMRIHGATFMDRLSGELPPPDADGSAASLAAARARFTPVPRKVAIIDRILWNDYLSGCSAVEAGEKCRTIAQIKVREQAGDCGDLEVDGKLVARFDKRGALRRIKAKEGDNDA